MLTVGEKSHMQKDLIMALLRASGEAGKINPNYGEIYRQLKIAIKWTKELSKG